MAISSLYIRHDIPIPSLLSFFLFLFCTPWILRYLYAQGLFRRIFHYCYFSSFFLEKSAVHHQSHDLKESCM